MYIYIIYKELWGLRYTFKTKNKATSVVDKDTEVIEVTIRYALGMH